MQRSAGRFALVIVSTLVILAGCQAPSWMTWKKDKDPSTPLAGSTSPKSSSPGATITKPSATASSVTTSPPATGYGAPATGISNPYAVGVSGNPYAAANTSNPYAAPSAAGTAGYDASSYSSTYPSTKTPGYGASNPYAPSNPYAAAPAAATAATTVQPQNGYYAQTYPATGTSNGVIVGNPYATGGAAAATAPAPSASAALPSRYDSDDLLGPRPGAVAAVNPASTVQNNSLPAASSAQSWGTATASDYGGGQVARPAANDPMASYSAMPAGSTGYSTPRSDVGQTGYSGQYPNASAATQVAASPAGSYHPGSVKEYKPAGVQSPYQSQTAAIPATYPGAGYTTGNAYDAGGMAPPAAASTSPTGYSGSYPTYPTTGGYAAPANGQAPSYTPNAPGTNYPSVGVNGSISAGGTVNR